MSGILCLSGMRGGIEGGEPPSHLSPDLFRADTLTKGKVLNARLCSAFKKFKFEIEVNLCQA